ncbi:hypothetical protein PV04_03275 [Phialophora macrospora]|uniref:Uncharacterized protein n=1 Tax=Phialophora macrospora TaxID=1851006 RepID=A0A0D2FX77_9EURO|nr:hypothetical protein PV04_03275 [Phialophora macrospora]
MASKNGKSGRPENSRRIMKPSSIRNSTEPPVRREERRRIPLTHFTLLTVPEDPMLCAYLRSKEPVDVSLEMRMSSPSLDGPTPLNFRSASVPDSEPNSDIIDNADQLCLTEDGIPAIAANHVTKGGNVSELELELDKFMASLTATQSPDAVIQTIASTKVIHGTISPRPLK